MGKPVSAATDVFAVGMLTHLLETGALPKRQPDGGVAIDAKAIGDADLAASLAKSTAFDPADRYASADAFGDDLRKITEGFPVSARPVSSFVSLKKLIARNKFASVMSGAAALAVIAGLIGVGIFAVQADEARIEAEEQLAAAEYLLEETNLTQDVLQTASTLMESYIIDEKGLNELDFRAYLQDGAEEAKQFYEANPSEASARIYYVANYLNTRGDYEGSRKLSQYMIDHPDTPEIRLAEARITQGRNLRELGDNDGSAKVIRDVLTWMRTEPHLFESPGYASIVTNLALSTLDQAELEDAVQAHLRTAQDTEKDANNRALSYNSLGVLVSRQGQFDRALEYKTKAVELSREAEGLNPISKNTRVLNLVGAILAQEQDVAKARSYMPAEDDVMDPERGHLRHRSLYRLYQALALQIEGKHQEAYEKAKIAHEMAVEQYPPGSPYYYATAGMLIETASLAGKPEVVEAVLETVLIPSDQNGGKPYTRGLVSQVFFLNAQGKRAEAIKAYQSLDSEKIAKDEELIYKTNLLKTTLGLN